MALTARELVFYIRAENQASGVFRRVAADIRRLPSNKVINIQQRYNAATQNLVSSNQKYLKGVNLGLAAQKEAIAYRNTEIEQQTRQLELAEATARAQKAAAAVPAVRGITKAGNVMTRFGGTFGPTMSPSEFNALQKASNDAAEEVARIEQATVAGTAATASQVVEQKSFSAAIKDTLSGKMRSLQLTKAEMDAQIKQNSQIATMNRLYQQASVNEANLARAQVEAARLGRITKAGGNLPGFTQKETASLSAAAQMRVANLIQQQKILGDSADAAALKIRAEGIALEEAASADKIARINMIAGAFSRVASAVRVAGIVAVAGIAVLAHSAANFETQTTLAATQARPPGSSAAKTQQIAIQLNDVILKQMKQFPATSKEMADSLYQIFSGTNIQSVSKASQFMAVFNKEAIAGGTDLATMTDAMITVTNNFDKGNYSIGTLTKNANIFFSAVRYGRMTAQQFANALAYIVPIAKDAGSTFKNVADDMAFFTRQTGGHLTRQDAQGYARLVQLLGRADVTAGLAGKGIQVFNSATGKMRPVVKILGEIHDKLHLTPQETLNFFKTISAAGGTGTGTQGTIQAIRIFSQGINNGKEYQKVVKEVNTDQNEFLRSYQAMSKTPAVQFKVAVNALKALGIELGRDAIPAIVTLGHYLIVMFKWFDGLSAHTKQLIAEFVVFGGAGAIVAGTLVKIAASAIQLATFLGILKGEKGMLGLGSAAGELNVKMGLLYGTVGLIVLLFTQFPHQTKAVIDALGGVQHVVIALGLAMAGARIGPWIASMLPAAAAIEGVGAAATAATGQLALLETAEVAATAESGILAGALALAFSPAVIGVGIALLVGGLIYLITRATAAQKAIQNLQHAIDSGQAAKNSGPQLDVNLGQAQVALAQAQIALAKTKTGTLAWKEAVLNVKQAMIGVNNAQGAVKNNNNTITKGLHDQLSAVLRLQTADIQAQRTHGSRAGGASPLIAAERAAKAAKNATDDFITSIDKLAFKNQKLSPLYSHNLFLIEEMTQVIGHIPNSKTLKMLLDNKNFKAQLKDFIDNMPAEYATALANAGAVMGATQGAAWLQQMTAATNAWLTNTDNMNFPGMETVGGAPTAARTPKPPPNPIGDVPSEYQQDQAKSAALATKNTKYMAALRNVAALDLAYSHSNSLKDEQAFYNAKTALDNKYGAAYQQYTSDYLSRAESTTKKANKTAETAAQKHMKSMQTIWTQAATTLQSTYQGLYSQNTSSFGAIFSGPFMNSGNMQDEITYGHKVTGSDLVNDLKSQITQFKNWRSSLNKLQKAGIPFELLQQIEAAGPSALPEVKALLSLKPKQLQSYFKMFKKGRGLIQVATNQDITTDLKHYRTYGQNIALAIIQGLRDEQTPMLSYFEDLVKKMFPDLARVAKHPAVKTKGSAGPKVPGRVVAPKIPHAKVHTGHPGESGRSTGGPGLSTATTGGVVKEEHSHEHFHFELGIDKSTQTEIKKAVRKATFHKRSRNL